jgi:hypothetical protein
MHVCGKSDTLYTCSIFCCNSIPCTRANCCASSLWLDAMANSILIPACVTHICMYVCRCCDSSFWVDAMAISILLLCMCVCVACYHGCILLIPACMSCPPPPLCVCVVSCSRGRTCTSIQRQLTTRNMCVCTCINQS